MRRQSSVKNVHIKTNIFRSVFYEAFRIFIQVSSNDVGKFNVLPALVWKRPILK